ncbi:hypothetical protein J2T57_000022 [Natronocella acetinitrilica]|uniref:DUF4150 domain-containing protein n=1 Tax=Natronocella acetinitrilica TaxID=414046 RepID=A0AAE3G076_9GAMM|nr:PAAR-like domain-containing protein [Natronocella acetinitrilica]MCP1672930.1 hypothetical protein [Natronocella acetinitrilica]
MSRDDNRPAAPAGDDGTVGQPVAGNVYFNGRTAVHAGSGGILLSPELCRSGKKCRTRPYTNVALSRDAADTATTVFVNGHPVCHSGSRFAVSAGDEGANCGGVRSGTIKGPAEFISSSQDVLIEGMPAVRNGDLMVSNHRNTDPVPLTQPDGPPSDGFDLAALEALEADDPQYAASIHVAGRAPVAGICRLQPNSEAPPPPTPRQQVVPANGDPHRHLAIPADESDTTALVLRLPDVENGHCDIPLGELQPTPRDDARADADTAIDAADTLLLPVLVLCHTDASLDPAHAEPPRPGRLYVFRDGYLWRELEVTNEAGLRDIDLLVHAGRPGHERRASTVVQLTLLLPHRVGGVESAFAIAYSETPWSWSRINSLGGMHPDDPRLAGRAQLLPSGTQLEGADERRAQRLQGFALDSLADAITPQPAREGFAAIEASADAPSDDEYLNDLRCPHTPAIYLHDPLGIATTLIARIGEAQEALTEQLEAIAEHPHYASAVLINRLCFDEALWDYRATRRGTRYDDRSEEARQARNLGRLMRRDYVTEDILQTAERARLQTELRDARDQLVALWQGQLPDNSGAIRDHSPDWISLEAALEDCAWLESGPRLLLYQQLITHLAPLLLAVADVDMGLDDVAIEDANLERPGLEIAARLRRSDDPLHRMAFPNADALAAARHGEPPPTTRNRPPRDTPWCRAEDIAAAFGRGSGDFALTPELRTLRDERENMLAALFGLLATLWRQTGETDPGPLLGTLLGLGKLAGNPAFEGAELVAARTPLTGKRIIGAEHLDFDAEDTAEARHRTCFWGPRLYNPHTGEINADDLTLAQARATEAENPGRINDPRLFDAPRWFWAEERGGTFETRGAVITMGVAAASAAGTALANRPPGPLPGGLSPVASSLLQTGAASVASAILLPIMLVNTWGATASFLTRLDEPGSLSRAGYAFSSLAGSSLTALAAASEIFTKERVGTMLTNQIPGRTGVALGRFATGSFRSGRLERVPYTTAAGAFVAAGQGLLAFGSAAERARAGNHGAAAFYTAHGVSMLTFGGASVIEAKLIARGALAGFLSLGPKGWAMLAVGTLLGVAARHFTDTPLEAWARHGPFAARRDGRHDADTGASVPRGDLAEFDADACHRALVQTLATPAVRLYRDPGRTVAGTPIVTMKVALPMPLPDGERLEWLCTQTVETWEREPEQPAARQVVFDGRKYPEKAIAPVDWEPIVDPDTGQALGMRYYFDSTPQIPGRLLGGEVWWQAKIRLRLATDGTLPPAGEGANSTESTKPQEVDRSDSGWIHAPAITFRYRSGKPL